jgi:hypothetical protein
MCRGLLADQVRRGEGAACMGDTSRMQNGPNPSGSLVPIRARCFSITIWQSPLEQEPEKHHSKEPATLAKLFHGYVKSLG